MVEYLTPRENRYNLGTNVYIRHAATAALQRPPENKNTPPTNREVREAGRSNLNPI